MACGTNSKGYLDGLFPDNKTQQISAADIREFVENIYTDAVLKEDIVDNLSSVSICKPLSAQMGKQLQDTKEDKIGLPPQDGLVLSSDTSGNRTWIPSATKIVGLQDVDINRIKLSNDDILTYDGATQKWVNSKNSIVPEKGGIAWIDTTTYVQDDTVVYKGQLYVCITGQPKGQNPETPGSAYWKKISTPKMSELEDVDLSTPAQPGEMLYYDGSKWKPIDVNTVAFNEKAGSKWDIVHEYKEGDVVSYQNELYISLTSSNKGANPGQTPASWETINDLEMGGRSWNAKTAYLQGDLVSYQNELYLAITGNQGNQPQKGSQFWGAAAEGELGGRLWQARKSYAVGDVVVVMNNGVPTLYVATANNAQADPATSKAKWKGLGLEGLGGKTYNDRMTYQSGDIVTTGNKEVYICLIDNLNGIHPGDALHGKHGWLSVTYSPTGGVQWSPTVDYKPGDIVSKNSDIYVAITSHINTDPTKTVPVGLKSDWKKFSTTEKGGITYNDTTTYDRGDVVSVGSELFIALSTNMTGDDPAKSGTGNWFNASQPEKGGVAWSSLHDYNKFDLVIDPADKGFYICIQDVPKSPVTSVGTSPMKDGLHWKFVNIRDAIDINFKDWVDYEEGDLVLYNAQLWTAKRGGHKGQWNQVDFNLVTPYERAGRFWDSKLEYREGDLVTVLPTAIGSELKPRVYFATKSITVGQPQPALNADWKLLDTDFNVNMEFNPTIDYNEFDTVYGFKNGQYHLFSAPHGGVAAGQWDDTKWTQITDHERAGLSWNPNSHYKAGESVTVGKRIYVALTDNTNKNPAVALNSSVWACMNRGGQAYDNTFEYYPGDTVAIGSHKDGKIYMALTRNTGLPPVDAKGVEDKTNWKDTSINEKGGIVWIPGMNYKSGDVVSYFDGQEQEWRVYVALHDITAAAMSPAPDGSNTAWTTLDTIERGGKLYDPTKTYKTGDVVSVDENGTYFTYISLRDQKGQDPIGNPILWFRSSVTPGTAANQILIWDDNAKNYVPGEFYQKDIDMTGLTKNISIPGKSLQSLRLFVNGSLQRDNQYTLSVTTTGSTIAFNELPQAGDWVQIDAVAV